MFIPISSVILAGILQPPSRTRRKTMRHSFILFSLSTLAVLTAFSIGTVYGVVVTGTGSYPDDVDEVNAAINGGTGSSGTTYPGGGTVDLVGTFNFGDDGTGRGTVNITTDGVTVTGVDGATIYGGREPFRVEVNSDVTIQNLKFDGFKYIAITIYKCGGTTRVSDNVITNGVEAFMPELPWFHVVYGIMPEAVTDVPWEHGPLTGDMYFENNIIDLSYADPGFVHVCPLAIYSCPDEPRIFVRDNYLRAEGSLSSALFLRGTPGATVFIEGNTLEATTHGIFVGAHYEGYPADGITIAHNTVKVDKGEPGPWFPRAGIDLRGSSNSTLKGNTLVIGEDDSFSSMGIRLQKSGYMGSYIKTPCGNTLQGNKICGQADYGVYVSEGDDNVFLGNNLATLDAACTYYFDEGSSGNQVRGYSGTVIDEGTDNFITGDGSMAGSGGVGKGKKSKPAAPLAQSSSWGRIKSLFK